jgi:hypothetical protein
MCELLQSSEIVIETPNKSNQSNLELTISVTRTPLYVTICTNSFPTLQDTYYVSTTKLHRLMLFREIIAVYCENHTEHRNTL